MASQIHYLLVLVFTIHIVTGFRVKRVINGQESDHSESTWLVSLQAEVVTSRFLGIPTAHKHVYCGGTLISDRWVLTAAHCFDSSTDVDEWHARFASPNVRMTPGEAFKNLFGKMFNRIDWRQLEYHPEKIVVHPDYSPYDDSWPNDIALVKLKETIPVSLDRVGVLDLDFDDETLDLEDDCAVYGWGCPELGAEVTKHLNRLNMTVISDVSCERKWTTLALGSMTNRICAEANGGAPCSGDSGGPLVCKTVTGNRVETGIVSFIHSTKPTEYPVVFTKVSDFKQWIQQTIRT